MHKTFKNRMGLGAECKKARAQPWQQCGDCCANVFSCMCLRGFMCPCTQMLKIGAFPAVFFVIWFVPMAARLFHPTPTDDGKSVRACARADNKSRTSSKCRALLCRADRPAAGPVPVVTAVFAPSQGWVNALLYTLTNKSVMKQV